MILKNHRMTIENIKLVNHTDKKLDMSFIDSVRLNVIRSGKVTLFNSKGEKIGKMTEKTLNDIYCTYFQLRTESGVAPGDYSTIPPVLECIFALPGKYCNLFTLFTIATLGKTIFAEDKVNAAFDTPRGQSISDKNIEYIEERLFEALGHKYKVQYRSSGSGLPGMYVVQDTDPKHLEYIKKCREKDNKLNRKA
jgi:hypothetical protein